MRISDWSSDVFSSDLRIGKGAVEIEMVDQVSAFQFGKESPALGIDPPPRAPPRCPATAIGSLPEIGFGQWSVRVKPVSLAARHALLGAVVILGTVPIFPVIRGEQKLVLYQDNSVRRT